MKINTFIFTFEAQGRWYDCHLLGYGKKGFIFFFMIIIYVYPFPDLQRSQPYTCDRARERNELNI